ncbi:hypothetical protein BV898_02369 [Hypsibius exemplaris]|uniref:Uncharacterized protein n=1 Tax=Hypsibius exemplaris TaxID=2072580 RepID=A0A1W0X7U8_HYPEX|nr:hypothetical protein BV898_02369 [Hypsibius exemplaris]
MTSTTMPVAVRSATTSSPNGHNHHNNNKDNSSPSISSRSSLTDAFVFNHHHHHYKPSPSNRSYSLVSSTDSHGGSNRSSPSVREYERRFFSEMELEFGPGIVDRLKTKFSSKSHPNSYAQGVSSASSLRDSKEVLYTQNVSPVPTKPAVASRKLEGVLQQKLLMNENVVIVDRGGVNNGGSALNLNVNSGQTTALAAAAAAATTANKTGHANYNSLAADLVNNSECIEGLVSHLQAIFDSKEPVPAQRKKRNNAPASTSAPLTITPAFSTNGTTSHSSSSNMTTSPPLNPPVPPPRPKKAQTATTTTTAIYAHGQNGKGPRVPQRPVHGPLGIVPVPLTPPKVPSRAEFRDTKRLFFSDDRDTTREEKASTTPSPGAGGKIRREPPPRPEKPAPLHLQRNKPVDDKLPTAKSALVEVVSATLLQHKQEREKSPLITEAPVQVTTTSFDYAAMAGSRLGSTVVAEKPVVPLSDTAKFGLTNEKLEKPPLQEASRLGVESEVSLMGSRPLGRYSLLESQRGGSSWLEASKIGVETTIKTEHVASKLDVPVVEQVAVKLTETASFDRLDTTAKLPDGAGKFPIVTGKYADIAGRHEDIHPDIPVKHSDIAGRYGDLTDKDSSIGGTHPDIIGKHSDVIGKHPDVAGKPSDTAGKIPDLTSRHSDTASEPVVAVSKLPDKADPSKPCLADASAKFKTASSVKKAEPSTLKADPVSPPMTRDAEKENTTPKRVTLKKTTGYGMTTIIDTKSRPIEAALPALKIDDPALLTSLRDIGLSNGGSGGRSSVDGSSSSNLEAELQKLIVLGHNSPTGSRSSLKSAGNSRSNLRITFNDQATKTHEYPSERSLLSGLDGASTTSTSVLTFAEHDGDDGGDMEESDTDGLSTSDSPVPTREGDLLRGGKQSALSRPSLSASTSLSSYKPSAAGEFQLGVERPHHLSSSLTADYHNSTPKPQPPSPSSSVPQIPNGRPLQQQRQQTGGSSIRNKTSLMDETDRREQWCVQSSTDEGNFSSNTTSDADDMLF